ncbi:glycerophosphodiester phosphodiesterase family protein [Phenylobacterium sp.]|uniref:glycerophosphodiester phosphodiesterase family protein n=1 Tax=Phenylobacterium sp. TaxID=1871053 RepID=UPI00260F0836|nr:glycerophosphodiester phosphodiesterase family protein [Phenylobacterium sp.]
MTQTKRAAALVGAALIALAGAAQAAPAGPAKTPTAAGILKAAEGRLPELLACLRDQKVALVGAHRGGPLAEHPENALVTMDYTTSLAPVFIETDVQQTFDEVLFMNHDAVLDRNTTGHGVIAEQRWAQIAPLKQRDPTGQPTASSPPRLADLLKWADGRVLLLLDVKPQTDADLLMAEVTQAGAEGRVMFLAYTVRQAKAMRALRPNAVLAIPMFDRDMLQEAKAAGLVGPSTIAMVRPANVDAQFIPELEALGMTVMSGTYGGPQTPDAVYRTSGDAGAYQALAASGPRLIVSNRPLAAAEAMLADPTYARRLATCGVAD